MARPKLHTSIFKSLRTLQQVSALRLWRCTDSKIQIRKTKTTTIFQISCGLIPKYLQRRDLGVARLLAAGTCECNLRTQRCGGRQHEHASSLVTQRSIISRNVSRYRPDHQERRRSEDEEEWEVEYQNNQHHRSSADSTDKCPPDRRTTDSVMITYAGRECLHQPSLSTLSTTNRKCLSPTRSPRQRRRMRNDKLLHFRS